MTKKILFLRFSGVLVCQSDPGIPDGLRHPDTAETSQKSVLPT
ncbi:hypothetical protein RMSM_02023 [Rhodopirellula maiorica SM1]|uniref:Uncharacterized protein n=1 Tax=Rhodopirellula maiorica SM1 TaxID=1265738 RepID=M5RPA9_9BACT|nr:hypothetical protein RMSM_02023 [Rhodopirellula maiorica SM1]